MPSLSTTKRELFAAGVARGLSYTRAAQAAGYSPHTAAFIGSQLAHKAVVKERIEELRQTNHPHARVVFDLTTGQPLGFLVALDNSPDIAASS